MGVMLNSCPTYGNLEKNIYKTDRFYLQNSWSRFSKYLNFFQDFVVLQMLIFQVLVETKFKNFSNFFVCFENVIFPDFW